MDGLQTSTDKGIEHPIVNAKGNNPFFGLLGYCVSVSVFCILCDGAIGEYPYFLINHFYFVFGDSGSVYVSRSTN